MKSFRKIEKAVGHARVMANRAIDERILTDAEVALIKSSHNQREAKRPVKNLWRFIMESKITKYSAAAVVALAFVLVLLNPFISFNLDSIAWGAIPQKVAGAETMIIRGTKTFTDPAKPDEVFEFAGIKWHFDLKKYFSKQHGLVEEGYVDGKLIYRITMNPNKKQALLIIEPYKKYMLYDAKDPEMQNFLENVTPDNILNLCLEGGYKELGQKQINGLDVEGFDCQDAKKFGNIFPKALFDLKKANATIWIRAKDQLPVQAEGNMVVGKCVMTMFHNLNMHEFNTLGDYNIELDEAIFDTTVPEGYSELTVSDILSLVPTKIKAGAITAGLGIILIPTGFISWRRHNRKKKAQIPQK